MDTKMIHSYMHFMAEGEGRGSNLTEEDRRKGGKHSHDNQFTTNE